MLVGRRAGAARARSSGPAVEIEGRARPRRWRSALRLGLARRAADSTGPPAAERDVERPAHHLHRLARRQREAWCAAPRGARTISSKRALERVDVERPAQPERGGQVVDGVPGLELSRNHSRCCASDSGSGASSARLARDAAARRLRSAPRPLAVDEAGQPGGAWAPRTARAAEARCRGRAAARESTCAARSEWPPSSKKLSWTPTRAHARAPRPQIAASSSSVGVARRDELARSRRRRRGSARAAPCGRPCRWG